MVRPGVVLAMALLLSPGSLAAQEAAPRLARGDLAASFNWVALNVSHLDAYSTFRSQAGYGLAAGRYWTDHLLTRLETTVTGQATHYVTVRLPIDGNSVLSTSRQTFASRRLTILQLYQFGRNQWLHPSAGIGVELVSVRSSRVDNPVISFNPATGQWRVVRDTTDFGHRTRLTGRAVVSAGLKGYLSRRAFGVIELRGSVSPRRLEDIQTRLGIGLDF